MPLLAGDPFQLVGRILERKYRVDRCVAEGGFAVVYAGHHLALDAPIAIKVPRRTAHADAHTWADVIAGVLTEAKTIAKLRHSAVVSVIDAGVTPLDGEDEWIPWMVMEWLEGETLEQHLCARRRSGGRSPAEALALLRPVLDALAVAHAAGIAHRDIKPSNVMLLPGPRGPSARVLDFGIAKVIPEREIALPSGQTQTTAQVRAFSPESAAPEQVAGTRTGPWTDVHAMGLLLAEVLTDAPAYQGDGLQDYYNAVFDPARPTPAKRGIDVGPWEPVLARALSLKPGDRHPNAASLLDALEEGLPAAQARFTASRTLPAPTLPPRDGASPRASRLPRARRSLLAGAALLLVVAASAALVVARRARPAGDVRAPAPILASPPPPVEPSPAPVIVASASPSLAATPPIDPTRLAAPASAASKIAPVVRRVLAPPPKPVASVTPAATKATDDDPLANPR